MKTPNLTKYIYATSLTLAFALAPTGNLRAELVNEEVRADSIRPENSALEEEVVILKKPQAAAQKRVVVQEEPAYEPVAVQAQAQGRASVGSTLDQGIQAKMGDVQTQFENALLKTLDRIKITVDDGAPSADSQAQAQAQSAPTVTTTIVQDSVVNAQGAPEGYMAVEAAPSLEADNEEGGESVAEAKEANSFANRVRFSPVLGWTTINSQIYNVDSRYTAGLSIEMDVSDALTAVASYSYSQYDIGLASGNPFYSGVPQGFYQNNLQTLQYNQNVFDAGLRYYLFPKKSAFRMFLGGGLGFNKGYLNYRQGNFNTFAPNQYTNLEDYVVTSFLGILETGGEVNLSKNVALGVNFKYATVLSAKESQPLNNYGFVNNGYGSNISPDQRVVGGSIAEDSFYSILGAVKLSF